MPRTLMQSVVSQLQSERKRLEDELHRVTAALTAFGNVYMNGRPKAATTRKKRTLSAAGPKKNNCCSEGTMGKGQSQQEAKIRTEDSPDGSLVIENLEQCGIPNPQPNIYAKFGCHA